MLGDFKRESHKCLKVSWRDSGGNSDEEDEDKQMEKGAGEDLVHSDLKPQGIS